MKIYTRTGDDGQTGLFGGLRVDKHDVRVEAYGAVDELNSVIGLVRAARFDEAVDEALARVQVELFDIGSELASAPGKEDRVTTPLIGGSEVEGLEAAIDRAEQELPALATFVLPGGTEAAARLHLARTACRRAERRIVELHRDSPVRSDVLRYVNRLSDLLFTWARLANLRANVPDVPWRGRDRT
jgi:cob(I)alamin adenosyltransferase